MAKSSIPEGKKRYSLTLTIENMEKFHHYITKVEGLSPNQVSAAVDSMISASLEAAQPIIDRHSLTGRKPTSADVMIIIGKAMEKIGIEEINEELTKK